MQFTTNLSVDLAYRSCANGNCYRSDVKIADGYGNCVSRFLGSSLDVID